MADPRPWQHVSEPATPVETDGQRIARGWLHSGEPMAGLARRIDEDRAALEREREAFRDDACAYLVESDALTATLASLACSTHRACQRKPGDCCIIGSVIGYWDQHWTEVAQERDRLAGERDALRTALLATRDHDEPDGPCWCPVGLSSEAGCRHTPRCRRARAALAACAPTTPEPMSRCRGCGAYVEADPRTPDGRGHQVPNADGSPGFCGPIDDPEHRGTEPAP